MSGQFDVFLTIDRNLQYQQNLRQMKVALVVLSAQNNKLETLKPLMPQVLEHLKNIEAGNVVEVRES